MCPDYTPRALIINALLQKKIEVNKETHLRPWNLA